MEGGEKLREQVRLSVVESRVASRDSILKIKRKALDDIVDIGRNVNEQEIIILANKLKTKSLVQSDDLAILKIAFVQSVNNIVAFLKIKGALHGLVRELSSTKQNFELLAAECICNLALGDVKSCLIVAKAAGPYLITILSGFNDNLMATSVWALGNLVSSGEKPWKILHSQGFLSKLLQLIIESDNLQDLRQELRNNSLTALSQLLQVGAKYLTVDEIKSISQTVVNLKNPSCKGFTVSLFLLSCMEAAEEELIRSKVYLKCLDFIAKAELNVETVTKYTGCVRTIANLITEQSGVCALEVFQNWNCIEKSIQTISLSAYTHLVIEFSWLLGNLMNHPSSLVQIEVIKFDKHFQLFESKFQNCYSQ